MAKAAEIIAPDTQWSVVWTGYINSCNTKPPKIPVNAPYYKSWSESAWIAACSAAFKITPNPSDTVIQKFFAQHFQQFPISSDAAKFTGYYLASLEASYAKTNEYNVPVYSWPSDLAVLDLGDIDTKLPKQRFWLTKDGHNLQLYPPRSQIRSHLGDRDVILWAKDEVELFFLQIQGSGVVTLPDGKTTFITYSGKNGRDYQSIGAEMVRRGLMTKDSVTMTSIKEKLRTVSPATKTDILNTNPSYVFFKETKDPIVGSSGQQLYAKHSLAVDSSIHGYGLPFVVHIFPSGTSNINIKTVAFSHDTGSAIKGSKRFDFFCGSGNDAMHLASGMNNVGEAFVLLPKR